MGRILIMYTREQNFPSSHQECGVVIITVEEIQIGFLVVHESTDVLE